MTVKELIEQLKKLPEDAHVFREDGAYSGSTTVINTVTYNRVATLDTHANTVVLS